MKRPNLNLHREVLAELTTIELGEIAGAAGTMAGASAALPTLKTCGCTATDTCGCTLTNTCGCGQTNTCGCTGGATGGSC